MSLTLQLYRSTGVSTLRCEGNICFGGSAESLERAVKEFANGILVIDLERVVLVDARGLGALVELYHWSEEHRVRLYIANPRTQLQELLRLTGLSFLVEPELSQMAS